MTGTMFRACVAVFFSATALLVGCSGNDGFSIPTISNVVVSPTTATQNQGGGTINVNVTMDFANAELDIQSYTVNMYDQNKNLVSTQNHPVIGFSGMSSGTINGTFVVSTMTVGNFTYNIYVSDNGGQMSNVVAGPFTVTAP